MYRDDRARSPRSPPTPPLAEHFRTPPDRLTEPQLRQFFLHLKNDRHFAPASLGIAYAGIKFFHAHTVPRDWPTLKRLRVPGEQRLPDVHSVDEVRQLLAAVRRAGLFGPFGAVHGGVQRGVSEFQILKDEEWPLAPAA